MASNTTSLPAPALAASRAALSAAFADQQSAEPTKMDAETTASEPNVEDSESLEPGEIQEVDMQAQAEGIRTVFSDPTNFNVKVCVTLCSVFLPSRRDQTECASPSLSSILFTRRGLSGLILRQPKAVTYLRHLLLRFLKHHCPRRPDRLWHMGGWRISSA